jgi:hypothetical protein
MRHAFHVFEHRFDAPEAAAGKDRRLFCSRYRKTSEQRNEDTSDRSRKTYTHEFRYSPLFRYYSMIP